MACIAWITLNKPLLLFTSQSSSAFLVLFTDNSSEITELTLNWIFFKLHIEDFYDAEKPARPI